MSGQDGGRGYLVQSIIALLTSLEDNDWIRVTIEPDTATEKVDILWQNETYSRAVQVKSSRNQIGKADAQAWASELESDATADSLELILIGPCAQSVAEMGRHGRVNIPCPKSMDFAGLRREAAHLLDIYLNRRGFRNQSPLQREILVNALVTNLSEFSTSGTPLSRSKLGELVDKWVGAIAGRDGMLWVRVSFERQRGIESAIAGKRLGPSDVDACPPFSILHNVVRNLQFSHFHEIVGTPGCGKSITLWQVAKHYHDLGYIVWRPSHFLDCEGLLASIPTYGKNFLVVDDIQQVAGLLGARLSELAREDTKVLIASTVDKSLSSEVMCLDPVGSVDQLNSAMIERRDEILAIVKQHDKRIGDCYGDMSFERRLEDAARQKSPWQFFWVLRGGWKTAKHEYESLNQFAHVKEIIETIAMGQIVTCDAGVSVDWLTWLLDPLGIGESQLLYGIERLGSLGLVIVSDTIRTKHITYANEVMNLAFRSSESKRWSNVLEKMERAMLANEGSLRGICWLMDSVSQSDASRIHTQLFSKAMLDQLLPKCLIETNDLDWAAGCFGRLNGHFNLSVEETLQHENRIFAWATSGSSLATYFTSNILNCLINDSDRTKHPERFQQVCDSIDRWDVDALILAANSLELEGFSSFGHLVNRRSFFNAKWRSKFFDELDWNRLMRIIESADATWAYAVGKLAAGLSFLVGSFGETMSLRFIRDIVPYICRATNERPCNVLNELDDVFMSCLGLAPKFLRGGRTPNSEQLEIATQIANGIDPEKFANGIVDSLARDMENAARSLAIIYEVRPEFLTLLAAKIPTQRLLERNIESWRTQGTELLHLLRFFSTPKENEPARSWVTQQKDIIEGKLSVILVGIAPNVAVEKFESGQGILLVEQYNHRWGDTLFALANLFDFDKEKCRIIVRAHFNQLEVAIYRLDLRPLTDFMRVFRALHHISPELFQDFVTRLDLSHPVAQKTLEQLRKSQRRELQCYRRLAKVGMRLEGPLAEIASELLEQLNSN